MAKTIRRRTLLAAGAAALAATTGCRSATPPASGTLLLRNVRVFDGERLTDDDSVLVEAGIITAVGRGLPAADRVPIEDGEGGTLLPGLIDAHAHVTETAGFDAARFGVTTLLDMFTTDPFWLPEAATDRTRVTNLGRADIWSAGIGATAPGGWPDTGGIPTLSPGDDPARFVADRLAEGSDYLKVFIEDGAATAGVDYRSLDDEQVRALVRSAHDQGVPAVAHVSDPAAAATAAEAGAQALMHVPWGGRLTDPQLSTLHASGLAVVPTLSVIAALGCDDNAGALRADPRAAPYLTVPQLSNLHRQFDLCSPDVWEHALHNVGALHAAGIPILAGADAPNPGTAHGISTLGELQLLVTAGLSPAEALTAATAGPARVFGLTDRGRIAPGRRGDLLLVAGDPITDIEAILDITGIWKNGFPVDRAP